MAYIPKIWKDRQSGRTPIDAASLNHIEQGIAETSATVEDIVPRLQAVEETDPVPGEAGHSPVLTWQGDQIAVDGKVAGPHLTGATGPQGFSPVMSLPGDDAFSTLANKIDMRSGDIRISVASDSTANGVGDWVDMFSRKVAARWPHLRVKAKLWNDVNEKYDDFYTIQDGKVLVPASDGNYVVDNFNRTGEIIGSMPESGSAWTGNTLGVASTNGSALVFAKTGSVGVNTTMKGGTTTTTLNVKTATTTAQQIRTTFGAPGVTTGRGVWAYVNVSNTGNLSAGLYIQTTAGGSRMIGTFNLTGLGIVHNSSTIQKVVQTITVEGQNITATFGLEGGTKATLTAQATEAEFAEFGTTVVLTSPSATAVNDITVEKFTYTGPAIPEVRQTLEVWNAAKAGGSFQYQLDRLDTMYPNPNTVRGPLLQAGTPETSVTETKDTLRDTFSRTGSVINTAPEVGSNWTTAMTSTPPSSDGNLVTVPSPSNMVSVLPVAPIGTLTTKVVVNSATRAVNSTLRMFFGSDNGSTNGQCIWITVSTTGAVTAGVYVRTTVGGYRSLGSIPTTNITAASATGQPVTATLVRNGLNLTGTLTNAAGVATTFTGTITQAEADELASLTRVSMSGAAGDGTGVQIDSVTATQTVTTVTPATPDQYGPDVPGTPIDVLIVAHGHNYGAMTPEAFLVEVDKFVNAYSAKHPESKFMFSSQNPQFAPAANPLAHAKRQAALRQYVGARKNIVDHDGTVIGNVDKGWSYIGGYERFIKQPDQGQSLMAPNDGIHPLASSSLSADDVSTGMAFWGHAAYEALISRSLT